MPEFLLALTLGSPLAIALWIGTGIIFGWAVGEAHERRTAALALAAMSLSCTGAILLLAILLFNDANPEIVSGRWLQSGTYQVRLIFLHDGLSSCMAVLCALYGFLVTRFSNAYMHREPGFHRFFAVLCLFIFAMLLLVLGGNAVLSFAGWELAGLCSYLLIAFFYDRATAVANATQAFITNRFGDAGFLLGIFLSFLWLGGIDWYAINKNVGQLDLLQANAIAVCFFIAAVAKSAQFPLVTWLARAMEGPTPSSALFYGAVMVHAGVYLMLRLHAVVAVAPLAMVMLVLAGSVTVIHGYLCGLVQTDIKSALIFSVSTQVGLMLLECGLGWWGLAELHLFAHALVRGYQFLTAPSVLQSSAGNPMPAPQPWLRSNRPLYAAALNRFWLEDFIRWCLVDPVLHIANDLRGFDLRVVKRAMGLPAPAVQALSSLAAWEERRIAAPLQPRAEHGEAVQVSGVIGHLTQWGAAVLQRLEEAVVLRGIGEGLVHSGRWVGRELQQLEAFLARPRYIVMLVLIVLFALA